MKLALKPPSLTRVNFFLFNFSTALFFNLCAPIIRSRLNEANKIYDDGGTAEKGAVWGSGRGGAGARRKKRTKEKPASAVRPRLRGRSIVKFRINVLNLGL